MNLQVEPPETKKRKKKTTKNAPSTPPPPPPSSPSLSLLPDEISVNCLARISRAYYPKLSTISKSFRSLLSSPELYAARSHIGSTEQCLYVCLSDESYPFPQWFTLWINPNRTLPDSMKKKKKKTIGKLLVPIPSSNFPCDSKSTVVVVGLDIYVIGGPAGGVPSSAVRVLDCGSHTWRDGPRMAVARKCALACVYAGKIYVMGGCGEDDDHGLRYSTQRHSLGNSSRIRVLRYAAKSFTELQRNKERFTFGIKKKTYAYDPNQDKWECCLGRIANRYIPVSACVMEGVWYDYCHYKWSWTEGGDLEDVKGLDSLGEMYKRNGGSSRNTTKLVSCGGKLLLVWEGYKRHNPSNRKKIWCAQIALRKDDGGEVWGDVEWVDVVQSVPTSCELLHCLVVSV